MRSFIYIDRQNSFCTAPSLQADFINSTLSTWIMPFRCKYRNEWRTTTKNNLSITIFKRLLISRHRAKFILIFVWKKHSSWNFIKNHHEREVDITLNMYRWRFYFYICCLLYIFKSWFTRGISIVCVCASIVSRQPAMAIRIEWCKMPAGNPIRVQQTIA